MKWPTQCVLNVLHFPWMAITPTSPRVNSEIVGPIGYLVAMMWHSGHSFSLGTGYNLHFLNFHQQQAIKQKLYLAKNIMKETWQAWNAVWGRILALCLRNAVLASIQDNASNTFGKVTAVLFSFKAPRAILWWSSSFFSTSATGRSKFSIL